jgi:hypothetical protein
MPEETKFKTELKNLINCHSKENGSDTPDHILADYLIQCLTVFDHAVNMREKWYGRKKPTTYEVTSLAVSED